MAQEKMTQNELLAMFETVSDQQLYETRAVTFHRVQGEDGKVKYQTQDGVKMPRTGNIVEVDPFSVALASFKDRKFGHSSFITKNAKGEYESFGAIQERALSLYFEGQLEDAAGVTKRVSDDAFILESERGNGRNLSTRLLILSGVKPDAKLRLKIEDTVTGENTEQHKQMMTDSVIANVQRNSYSAVDKAWIIDQWTRGIDGVQYNQEEISRILGLTPANISQLKRINELIPEAQRLIHEDRVSYAKAIVKDKVHKLPAPQQMEWVGRILADLEGAKKGKHAPTPAPDGGNGSVSVTMKTLREWAAGIESSVAHKAGSKRFAGVLLRVLSGAGTLNDLDDALENNTLSR